MLVETGRAGNACELPDAQTCSLPLPAHHSVCSAPKPKATRLAARRGVDRVKAVLQSLLDDMASAQSHTEEACVQMRCVIG